MAEHDPQIRASILEILVQNETWICPTLVDERRWLLTFDDRHGQANPNYVYIPPPKREEWIRLQREAESRMRSGPGSWEDGIELYRLEEEVLLQMSRAGIGLLAGRDVGNVFLVPGFSLHDELELMVEAGLSAADALRSATINPARFLLREDLGEVAPGKQANLVLLEGDPLRDIGAVRRIRAVVWQGNWIGREALDAMLADVRNAVGSTTR